MKRSKKDWTGPDLRVLVRAERCATARFPGAQPHGNSDMMVSCCMETFFRTHGVSGADCAQPHGDRTETDVSYSCAAGFVSCTAENGRVQEGILVYTRTENRPSPCSRAHSNPRCSTRASGSFPCDSAHFCQRETVCLVRADLPALPSMVANMIRRRWRTVVRLALRPDPSLTRLCHTPILNKRSKLSTSFPALASRFTGIGGPGLVVFR